MSKFIYRMQSILNLKYKMEEQAKMEFATARIKLDEEEEKLKILFERKAAYEEEGRKLQEDNLVIQDILDNKNAISQLKFFIEEQKIQIKNAEDKLEEKRVKLQEVMQERQVQEKLKEKAFEVFMKEENSRESKEIDELTSYRYGQKRR